MLFLYAVVGRLCTFWAWLALTLWAFFTFLFRTCATAEFFALQGICCADFAHSCAAGGGDFGLKSTATAAATWLLGSI
jgi:hypothetical protein